MCVRHTRQQLKLRGNACRVPSGFSEIFLMRIRLRAADRLNIWRRRLAPRMMIMHRSSTTMMMTNSQSHFEQFALPLPAFLTVLHTRCALPSQHMIHRILLLPTPLSHHPPLHALHTRSLILQQSSLSGIAMKISQPKLVKLSYIHTSLHSHSFIHYSLSIPSRALPKRID